MRWFCSAIVAGAVGHDGKVDVVGIGGADCAIAALASASVEAMDSLRPLKRGLRILANS